MIDSSTIDYFNSTSPFKKPASWVASIARESQWRLFLRHFGSLLHPRLRVLDFGSTPDFSISDSNFFTRKLRGKVDLTLCSIEDCSKTAEILGAKFLPAQELWKSPEKHQFDITVSIAVMEHVGNWEQQNKTAELIRQTSKYFFITTPNRWFPVEFHTYLPFFHWLPKNQHRWILKNIARRDFWSQEANLNLLGTEVTQIFDRGDKNVHHEYTRLLGIPSNHVVIRSPTTVTIAQNS